MATLSDPFVNIDVMSSFSFLWGTFKPEELVEHVAQMGQRAVALTDAWSLFGAVRFWKACKRHGIQGIIGVRVRLFGQGWVVLLAKDFEGYGNICKLASFGLLQDSKNPRDIPLSLAQKHSRGLVCICGVHGSNIRLLASEGLMDGAGIKLLALRSVFRQKDSLFLAIQSHVAADKRANHILMDLAERLEIPPVAVSHTAFLRQKDFYLHQILVGIQQRHHHLDIPPLPNDSFFLASSKEMLSRLGRRDLVERSLEVANLCSGFSFPSERLKPPRFRDPKDADDKLARKTLLALARKFNTIPRDYIVGLEKELSEIRSRRLSDFFLLVSEICAFAKKKGIRHSIRGSAAGSMVVHLLHNGPDPIRHRLLFERFMNSGRNDLPDIDIDFDSERRDEVTSWLMERFARPAREARAALVATIHTFRPRSSVRLAARALGYPLSRINRIVKALPWSLRGISLKKAVARLPELKDSPLKNEPVLLKTASALEGLPFQASVHLGGVILSAGQMANWCPLWMARKGFPVAQLDKDDVDWLGLLKIDLLGLRMHTAIEKALSVLKQQGIDLDIDDIPLDDEKTFDLLCSGRTLGIFQVESSGQRNLIGRLQPRTFDDIVAEISLFRPGPVKGNMVAKYVRRRNGLEQIDFIHPDLEDIVGETYGVIVFQEQVLRIVERFAGLSYSEADAFRRAMTRGRSRGEMKMLKSAFIQAALRMGHSEREAELVFKHIAAFAAYGFCKAHAVAFAHITWQSAWLKAHHPSAFYVGLLNAGNVGSYPPFVILNEARRNKIHVLPPHVNKSGLQYQLEEEAIRCPLQVIRGVGMETAGRIVRERDARGRFVAWSDFFSRVQMPVHARYMTILAGALEGLPGLDKDEESGHRAA